MEVSDIIRRLFAVLLVVALVGVVSIAGAFSLYVTRWLLFS